LLLNVENGTLNLRTGELEKHKKEDYITRLAQVTYDPKATAPTWDRFLNEIMQENAALVEFLRRGIGYAATGSTEEQCLFILYGTGANGKSTFLNTLKALLGDYSQQTPTDSLLVKRDGAIPNDLARLKGARLVTAIEAEDGKRLAESLVKQLTGGDTITARFLRQEFFEFEPTFKIFLATNHRPVIKGTDNAIWRRIRLIPFDVTFPEDQQDRHLSKKLMEELPGILNWVIHGCLDWREMGLDIPDKVLEATQGYREDMDVLGGFIGECCETGVRFTSRAKELYKRYEQWCADNGERPASNKKFGQSLIERGFEKDRSKHGIIYYGIQLVTD
jgi:putative DNA primase/helicase